MWFKTLGRTKKVIKVGRISAKDDILTVKERKVSHIVNNTKLSLEMTSSKREADSRQLKVANMRIKKRIKKK